MNYRITNYQDGYIDKQIEIGNQVMSEWKFQNQSSKELIEQIYAKKDFDPETRFYAFLNEDMVGYLPSKIVGSEDGRTVALFEFPIVLSNHKDAIIPLMKEALDVLREKDVDLIRVRASKHWGNTIDLVEKYGFEYEKDTVVTSAVDLNELNIDELNSHSNIVEMDYSNEAHLGYFRESFPQTFPMRYEGEIEKWLEYYEHLNRITQLLYMEDDKCRGHLLAIDRGVDENNPNVAVTAYYSQGENKEMKMKSLMEQLLIILDENGIETFGMTLGTREIPFIGVLTDFGIEFETQVSHYTKSL